MFTIDRVTPSDLEDLFRLLDALAAYEKLDPPDADARERLRRDILGEQPRIDAFLLKSEGRAIGYLILLETYSSFRAQPTLYIEDIFMQEEYRRKGFGRRTMRFVLDQARRRSCGRIEWQVLNWNEPAVRFYEKVGAERMDEWSTYRLSAEQFESIEPQLTME